MIWVDLNVNLILLFKFFFMSA